ncbi:MAG: hypothetical protein CFE31_18890 [Rhizobiales bacterium PAR1]|nr:MAG: hypothetical protein CFE31_18890 [Rhizobiales bacterium PAR1]
MSVRTRSELVVALRDYLEAYPRDLDVRVDRDLLQVKRGEARADLLFDRERQADIFSALYEIAAEHGPDAAYTAEVHEELRARGFDSFRCDKVLHRIEHGFAREVFTPGSEIAGVPGQDLLDQQLGALGAELTDQNRNQIMKRLAERQASALRSSAIRYREALGWPSVIFKDRHNRPGVSFQPGAGFPAPPYFCADSIPRGLGQSASLFDKEEMPAAPEMDRPDQSHDDAATVHDIQPDRLNSFVADPVSKQQTMTITEVVERAIESKGKLWSEDSIKQHRAVARLFIKLVGVDDVASLTKTNIMSYRSLLNRIPTFYGRRREDWDMSIDALIARAKQENDPVGLGPATINRHLTQLRAIVEHAEMIGCIGDALIKWTKIRTKDTRRGGEKRNAFTEIDIERIFCHRTWTNNNSKVDPSTYWVPIIGLYTGARLAELSGLMVNDIDIEHNNIIIDENKNRRIKTAASRRCVPLHREIIRLGFIHYVKAIKNRSNYNGDLFPDLRARGQKTSLSDLFAKNWSKILGEIIPNAKNLKLCFHSLRHSMNMTMIEGNTIEAMRCAVLGQEGDSVNTTVYRKNIPSAKLTPVIDSIPSRTDHLIPRKWN